MLGHRIGINALPSTHWMGLGEDNAALAIIGGCFPAANN
jgi:hypothetical protein